MFRAAPSGLEEILGRLSLEYQALLLCSRVRLDAGQEAQLSNLLADRRLSWPSLVYLAGWHRLSGLLYHHLQKAASSGQVPPWVQTRLRAAYVHNAARNLYFQGQLRTALTALGSHGIPVIALKGVVLVDKVFHDPGLRPMKDIDLLVPAHRAEEAQTLLCQMGYQPMGSPEVQERTRREHRHLPVLADPQRLVALEVHSHIVAKGAPSGLTWPASGSAPRRPPSPGYRCWCCARSTCWPTCRSTFSWTGGSVATVPWPRFVISRKRHGPTRTL